MRQSLAALLALGCLLLTTVPAHSQTNAEYIQTDALQQQTDPRYSTTDTVYPSTDAVYTAADVASTDSLQPQQTDSNLRLSAARQARMSPQDIQGSTIAFVGLGATAEQALGDAEHVAEVLLAADGAAIAAQKTAAVVQSRKHRRVKHGRHNHKRVKKDDALAVHEQKDLLDPGDADGYDVPSEVPHSKGWEDSSSYRFTGAGRSYGHKSPTIGSHSSDDDDTYEGSGRKRYKKQQQQQQQKGGGHSADERDTYDGPQKGPGGGGDYHAPPGGGHPGTYMPMQTNKNMCKQVLLEEEEVEVVFAAGKDKATVTTLLGTCANPVHPLPTLGGGCVVECQHVEDLCHITPLNSHVFVAPANFKSTDNYYPVMCSYRADAPLKGSCNIVMKVACCGDKPKGADSYEDKSAKTSALLSPTHKVPSKPSAYDDDDDDDDDSGEYYAVVKSKLLRIPLQKKY